MIPPNRDLARWRAALREGVEIKGSGLDCPSPERIWESASGALDRDADGGVLDHVGECPACGLAWELARDLGASEAATSIAPGVRRAPGRWAWTAAAAVVLAAVAGTWWLLPPAGPEPDTVYRDTSGDWMVSSVPEDLPVPRDACVLRWTAGPEGTTYDVGVTGERLEPVARAWNLDRAGYRVDPAALDVVPRGESILWRVTAHLPDGRSAVSRTFVTRLE